VKEVVNEHSEEEEDDEESSDEDPYIAPSSN